MVKPVERQLPEQEPMTTRETPRAMVMRSIAVGEYIEVRCFNCNRLLGKAAVGSRIELKCKKCGRVLVYQT